jgi:hypothetical protein
LARSFCAGAAHRRTGIAEIGVQRRNVIVTKGQGK